MWHGSMIAAAEFVQAPTLSYRVDRLEVKLEFEGNPNFTGAPAVDPSHQFQYYEGVPALEPVELIRSTVYKTYDEAHYVQAGWSNGTTNYINGNLLEIAGDVLIKKRQGDIMMGEFGD